MGGGQQTQKTVSKLPAWAVPYAQELLGLAANQFFPGGKVAQMPASLNRQVAGMTPDQINAISMIQQQSGVAPLSSVPDTSVLPSGIAPGSAPPTPIAGLNAPPPTEGAPNPVTNPITNPAPPKMKKGKGLA